MSQFMTLFIPDFMVYKIFSKQLDYTPSASVPPRFISGQNPLFSPENDFKLLREQIPSSMYAKAGNPSTFNSNKKSGSLNGVRKSVNWAVSMRGNGMEF